MLGTLQSGLRERYLFSFSSVSLVPLSLRDVSEVKQLLFSLSCEAKTRKSTGVG